MQTEIRKMVSSNSEENIVLMADGFEASLLFVAQSNLLPYYKKHIKGLILNQPIANFYTRCLDVNGSESNSTCGFIEKLQDELKEKATKMEILKALSPVLQMIPTQTKTVLLGLTLEEKALWKSTFERHDIAYQFVKENARLKIGEWFALDSFCKMKRENKLTEPNYNAPLLRFHLFKIAYRSKNKLTWEKGITYYTNEHNQSYDVVYKKSSKTNPLLIYVHGGGWSAGDKSAFHALAEQYADKGFTAVTLNYRLLNLPKVGFKEMVNDVRRAITSIMDNAKNYHADVNRTMIMADSAGAELSFIAMSQLSSKYKIKKAVFNSMPSDFTYFSKEKLERLSGLNETNSTKEWIEHFSPIANLMKYRPTTLCISSLKDRVVTSKQLENLEIQSVINFNNISSLWVENANHSIAPSTVSMTPSCQEIEFKIDRFIQ